MTLYWSVSAASGAGVEPPFKPNIELKIEPLARVRPGIVISMLRHVFIDGDLHQRLLLLV